MPLQTFQGIVLTSDKAQIKRIGQNIYLPNILFKLFYTNFDIAKCVTIKKGQLKTKKRKTFKRMSSFFIYS